MQAIVEVIAKDQKLVKNIALSVHANKSQVTLTSINTVKLKIGIRIVVNA